MTSVKVPKIGEEFEDIEGNLQSITTVGEMKNDEFGPYFSIKANNDHYYVYWDEDGQLWTEYAEDE